LQNQAPITSSNLALMGGVSLNAVSVNSTNPAWLTYADTNGYCYGNINLRKGSLRMWFQIRLEQFNHKQRHGSPEPGQVD